MNNKANKFKETNQELFELAKKTQKKLKKKETNIVDSFFAKYLQEYEFRIVQSIVTLLMKYSKKNKFNGPST